MCDQPISLRMKTYREDDTDLEQPHGSYAILHVKAEAVVDAGREHHKVTSPHMTTNPCLSSMLW